MSIVKDNSEYVPSELIYPTAEESRTVAEVYVVFDRDPNDSDHETIIAVYQNLKDALKRANMNKQYFVATFPLK